MRIMKSEENMRSRWFGSFAPAITFILVACLLPGVAAGQSQAAAPASAHGPKAFDTPQQAADAVIKAAGDYDVPQLMAIFGPDGEDFVSGGDPVQAKNSAIDFAKEAQAKYSITMESSKPGQSINVVGQNTGSSTLTSAPAQNRAVIIVGEEAWPFPVPLIKKNGKWYFDAKVGRQTFSIAASAPTNWMPSRFAADMFRRNWNTHP